MRGRSCGKTAPPLYPASPGYNPGRRGGLYKPEFRVQSLFELTNSNPTKLAL